jgi:hypothetical protein
VHTGTNVKGEWQNVMAIQFCKDGEPSVIEHVNHFIHGPNWGVVYNNKYKIYDNLVKNYIEILNCKQKKQRLNENDNIGLDLKYYNDLTYFSMLDAFSFSNSGHNLSDFLNRVDYIIKNNLKHILIYKEYTNTNNFKLLSLLLPADCIFYELEFDSIYKFNNIIVVYPVIMNVLLHERIIHELRTRIINDWSEKLSHLKNKKIILMKTHRNNNVMLTRTQFNCEPFLQELEMKGYIYVIPEELDVFELCIYLLFADTIVYSTGSILYTNKIMFNYDAKLVYMCFKNERNCCTDARLLEKSLIIETDKNVYNLNEIMSYF